MRRLRPHHGRCRNRARSARQRQLGEITTSHGHLPCITVQPREASDGPSRPNETGHCLRYCAAAQAVIARRTRQPAQLTARRPRRLLSSSAPESAASWDRSAARSRPRAASSSPRSAPRASSASPRARSGVHGRSVGWPVMTVMVSPATTIWPSTRLHHISTTIVPLASMSMFGMRLDPGIGRTSRMSSPSKGNSFCWARLRAGRAGHQRAQDETQTPFPTDHHAFLDSN